MTQSNAKVASATPETSLVHVDREEDVGFITIDNPPVNALSRGLRAGLIEAISKLSDDPSVASIILSGANETFVAGADLREFGKPLSEPTLPEVIALIEDCPKPVIAAIQGAALGGGYELALACDGRVALADAVVGLPEGTFGIIPGAGGTARIARLVDAATALEIVSSCRRIKAPEAEQLALIDAIVPELRTGAVKFAKSLSGQKHRLRDWPALPVDEEAFNKAAQAALRRGKNRPYAAEQVSALNRAHTLPFDEVLAQDRDVFRRLRETDESAALRHLFFAEREAARVDGLAGVQPLPVKSVGIVGAGTMGSGIAAAFLAAGIPVILVDFTPEVLAAARERITSFLAKAATSAVLTTTTDFAALAGCDLILEAVFENMSVKQELLRRLDGIVKQDAILASNTSYLNLDTIAEATANPSRVVGLHFFAPAHIMKLLEVVRGAKTAPEVLATAMKLGRVLGKVSVVSAVGEGFIGNRIYNAYRVQCEAMLLAGASPEEIDEAVEAIGFAMGPFSVSDLSGLDIAWANRKRKQAETGDRSDVPVLQWLVEAGRLGRKTGEGWYRYEGGKRIPDPAVDTLVDNARAERGAMARPLPGEEIQNRALAAIVNEALLVLQDRIAARASDVDLVLIHGYGFPKHLGGPLHWAARQDPTELAGKLSLVAGAGRLGDLGLLDRHSRI